MLRVSDISSSGPISIWLVVIRGLVSGVVPLLFRPSPQQRRIPVLSLPSRLLGAPEEYASDPFRSVTLINVDHRRESDKPFGPPCLAPLHTLWPLHQRFTTARHPPRATTRSHLPLPSLAHNHARARYSLFHEHPSESIAERVILVVQAVGGRREIRLVSGQHLNLVVKGVEVKLHACSDDIVLRLGEWQLCHDGQTRRPRWRTGGSQNG